MNSQDEMQSGSFDPHPAPDGTPEEQMRDGVLDRPAGETYNPNSPDVVEQNRARFEALNRQLRDTRQARAEEHAERMQHFAEEAQEAAQDPAHQKMLDHQEEHAASDPPAERAGQEEDVPEASSPGSTVSDPNQRPAQSPFSSTDPDRWMQPPVT